MMTSCLKCAFFVAVVAAVRVDDDPGRQHGTRHAFVQRTEIAGQPVGQHRHNPVGEIAGVAAFARFTVQGRPRRDVMGHVGDGDPEDMSALVLRVLVRFGKDRVVMVARISAYIDFSSSAA